MRKVSLRAKVAGGLGAFTFAFVLTLVLAIGLGFEPIYYSIQKHNMVTAAKKYQQDLQRQRSHRLYRNR